MSLKAILKGTVLALVMTLIFIAASAAVLYFSAADESVASIVVYAGTALGVTAGAVCTARKAERKVLFNCLLTGAVYLAVMAAFTLILKGMIVFNYHFFIVVSGVAACCLLGSITGKK